MSDAMVCYAFGVIAVVLAMFVTAARGPRRACRSCRFQNRVGAAYCARCGRSLQS